MNFKRWEDLAHKASPEEREKIRKEARAEAEVYLRSQKKDESSPEGEGTLSADQTSEAA